MPSAVHLVGCRSLNNDEFYNGNHREVLENSSISNEVINLNHINSDCASISPTHKLNSSSHHKQPTNLVNNNSQKSSSPKSDNLHFNSPILGVNCRPPPTSPVTPDDAPMFFSSPPQASQNSSRVNLGRVFVSTGRKDSFERQGNSTYDEDDVLDPVELSMDDFTPGPKGSFDRPSADRLAKRLFNLDGFSLTAVAKQLSKKNEFAQMVSTAYFQYYDFTGIRVDEALRKFMSRFVFIGETQERERILNHFSARYFQCNPNVFPSHDSVDYLVCAIILLNQDLHGIVPHGGKRMTMNQFISNVLHPGPSDETFDEYSEFSKQLLKDIYNSVKSSPLQMADDDEENCQQVGNGKPPIQIPSTVLSPTSENDGGVLDEAINAVNGILLRKWTYEADLKKTTKLKRSWKQWFVCLQGLSLHHYKSQRHISDLKLTVPLHHAFAHPAKHYSKKNHVFQLRTADLSEYLYQCKSDEEMSEWINAINLYAAYSAPPLPCGVSSAPSKPQRPLLPHHFTSYHVRDQIKQWEECVNKCDSDQMTSRLRMKAASSKSEVEDYEKHLQCLEVDHQRYHVYIERLLETTNRTSQAGSELPPEAWKSSSKNTQVNRLQTTFLPENSIDYGVL